ncbi:unnamed protein product [Malus baccata var. baccata]
MVTRSKAGIFKPKILAATKHPIGTSNSVPTTYSQASKHEHWRQAIIKRKPDGTIDRYKARLVAKGFHQQEGFDFQETFSLVAKPVQPLCFIDPSRSSFVCKLNKSLYGLKQAPKAWYDKLFHILSCLGFANSKSDRSLFVHTKPSLVIVLVYVDDILVTGPNVSHFQAFIHQLSTLFPVKDLGPLHFFLGKYALDLLVKTNMDGCKPCSTPLGTAKLDHIGPLLTNPKKYLTWTRPYISFAVTQVYQFLHCPREPYLQAVKRILRFLKGSGTQAYFDVDWTRYTFDTRSTSGYCVYLGPNLISWSAKKQHTVARSSIEAEYRSLAHTAAELTWICKILKDVTFPLRQDPRLWCENVSAISLASNPVFHARTKHVEIDYHYIRELVLAN